MKIFDGERERERTYMHIKREYRFSQSLFSGKYSLFTEKGGPFLG